MNALKEVAARFHVAGELVAAVPWGSGHINDTYAATYRRGAATVRYVHQRLNPAVFTQPQAVMENMERVTAHLRGKSSRLRPLTLVKSREGAPYWRDADGSFWRTFEFIEGARTVDAVEDLAQAREVAWAFGEFQRLLSDFGGPRLHEPIPGFHYTPARFEALESAVSADVKNRAAGARAEIDFALGRKSRAGILIEMHGRGELPERITHNDTKINNVLLDEKTGRSVCVVDLDTVMPGLACYDFGDMARDLVSPSAEDERDLSKVRVRREVFEALARGYLEAAGSFLTKAERKSLALGGTVIALELGARFLTDYLSGDAYFKTHRPGQNLERCRAQFKLAELLEKEEGVLTRLIEKL